MKKESIENWGKNNVTPVMFRTPEQYVYDGNLKSQDPGINERT